MSTELLNRLDQKVTSAVETLELLKMEVEELREENTRLKQEQEEWANRLTAVLSKLDEAEAEESEPAAPSHQVAPQDQAPGQMPQSPASHASA